MISVCIIKKLGSCLETILFALEMFKSNFSRMNSRVCDQGICAV